MCPELELEVEEEVNLEEFVNLEDCFRADKTKKNEEEKKHVGELVMEQCGGLPEKYIIRQAGIAGQET